MRLVVIESPYAGDVTANVSYAQACMADCLRRGEAPFASHLLFTQALDDTIPAERAAGISAGLQWAMKADATVVYTDHGITPGMRKGINHAVVYGRPVEYRSLHE